MVTYEQERQLRQLILFFVQAVADRGASLPKIKLFKIFYLLDLEIWRLRGAVATGLDWVFYHYGPYAHALEPVLERAEGVYFERRELRAHESRQLAAKAAQLGEAGIPLENEVVYLYRPLRGLPDERIEDSFLLRVAQRISGKWAASDTASLLEHVYSTPPIAHGKRYQPIDWNLAPREVGRYGSRARYFLFPDETRAAIETAWSRWQESGADRWTPYEPAEWLFDEVWEHALGRMDADEGKPATGLRIAGDLPQGQRLDD